MTHKKLLIPFRKPSGRVVYVDLTPVPTEGNLFHPRDNHYFGCCYFESPIECLYHSIQDMVDCGFELAWEEYD